MHYCTKYKFLFLIFCCFIAKHIFAADLSFSYGITKQNGNAELARNWQIYFRQDLQPYFSWSESYLNEGHVFYHKRDGLATQFWGQIPFFTSRFKLAAGLGLYFYADTKSDDNFSYADKHGVAPIFSIEAIYNLNNYWFAKFTYSYIHPNNNYIANLYVLGFGYRFFDSPKNNFSADAALKNELTIFLGQKVYNDLNDEKNFLLTAEYRRNFLEHFDWTLSWLCEKDFGTQFWLVDNLQNKKFNLGIGVGPAYVKNNLDGLVSIMASYHFKQNWFGRILWNRVLSNNNNDRDDFLVGIGYKF